MTTTDELFSLYLSGTDCPVVFDGTSKGLLNRYTTKQILENDSALEEMVECPELVLTKKIALNPFTEEELRCELFEKIANNNHSEEIFSQLCQESYFANNLITQCKSIVRQTDSIMDWKISRQESMRRLYEKFIENYIDDTTDNETIEKIKNKIIKGINIYGIYSRKNPYTLGLSEALGLVTRRFVYSFFNHDSEMQRRIK